MKPQNWEEFKMKSLFIGIDWADEDHDVCITSEVGKCLSAFAIDDSILGLHKFNSTVSSYGVEPSEVHIAIETPHGLMVNALIRFGYNVYPINPKAVETNGKHTEHPMPEMTTLTLLSWQI